MRVLAVALVVLSAACAIGVRDEELAQPSIAVVYWTHEDAHARAEAERDARGARKVGVARAGDLGRLLGAPDPQAERFPGHIALVDPSTGEVERIEDISAGAVPLAWSADHRRLLFGTSRVAGRWQLYSYDVAARETAPVTVGDADHPRGDFGPSGGLVYTQVDRASGVHSLWLRASPSERARQLFEGPLIQSVRWSPRGDMLLVDVEEPERSARSGSSSRTIFAIPTDAPPQTWPPNEGSAVRALGRGRDPAFSRDGEWIVYSARVGSGWRLRRMRVDGGARSAIGPGSRDEFEPALSPDGKLVAYVSEEARFMRLFVRRADGSGERLLVSAGAVARPVW